MVQRLLTHFPLIVIDQGAWCIILTVISKMWFSTRPSPASPNHSGHRMTQGHTNISDKNQNTSNCPSWVSRYGREVPRKDLKGILLSEPDPWIWDRSDHLLTCTAQRCQGHWVVEDHPTGPWSIASLLEPLDYTEWTFRLWRRSYNCMRSSLDLRARLYPCGPPQIQRANWATESHDRGR